MNIDDFVKNVADLFFDTDPSVFNAETKFKEIPEWSSLLALSLVAMIEDEYAIRIKGDDIRNAESILDLFRVIGKD
ncbi:MAG: acyl carrier protein [Thermoguttaceae bacterium]|jgi:acyl carrier protein